VITRFQRCVGIKFFRLWRWQLEVWFCPRGEVIPLHSHQQCDSRITHWWGNVEWMLGDRRRTLGSQNVGWTRHVPAGHVHGAKCHTFSVFSNLEIWTGQPTSAAVDFVRA
jgi:hypothetical protein